MCVWFYLFVCVCSWRAMKGGQRLRAKRELPLCLEATVDCGRKYWTLRNSWRFSVFSAKHTHTQSEGENRVSAALSPRMLAGEWGLLLCHMVKNLLVLLWNAGSQSQPHEYVRSLHSHEVTLWLPCHHQHCEECLSSEGVQITAQVRKSLSARLETW